MSQYHNKSEGLVRVQLIIKGTLIQAIDAAKEHGIILINPWPNGNRGEISAQADATPLALNKYFTEEIRAKIGDEFPAGSLLFWAEVK